MVCKNCGADLKPGVKYCLNCGNYIEDDEETDEEKDEEKDDLENDSEDDLSIDDINLKLSDNENEKIESDKESDEKDDISFEEKVDIVEEPKKKKKKMKLSMTDIIIYGVLSLIIIVSLIVMVLSLTNGNKQTNTTPQSSSTPVQDTVVEMTDYTVKFPGNLNYSQENDVIYISDGDKYTFSYKNSLEKYEKYANDITIIENSLKKSGYTVISSETRLVNNTEFLIYKFKSNSTIKYLYVTQVNDKYITMGTIEINDDGDWKDALPVINKINRKIKFKNEESEDDEITKVIENVTSDLSRIIF